MNKNTFVLSWAISVSILVSAFNIVAAQETSGYSGPIIDMHMHALTEMPVTPDGDPAPLPCYPVPCAERPAAAGSGQDIFRMTLEIMERHNVVLGFLSSVSDRELENTLAWVDAAPDGKFIASAWICDPDDVDFGRIEAEYQAGRLKGMGEVGSQYCGIAIDDPRLARVFELVDEYDVPVLVHSHGGGKVPSDERFRLEIGRPTRIEEVLVRHPDIRLYIEDSGFPYLEDTIALMYRYPNVYGDLSNLSWMAPRSVFYSYLERLIDAGLGQRLMFGSDQNAWPESIPLAIEAIDSAPFLSDEQKRNIFYNNAARFLRLTEEEIAAHHGH